MSATRREKFGREISGSPVVHSLSTAADDCRLEADSVVEQATEDGEATERLTEDAEPMEAITEDSGPTGELSTCENVRAIPFLLPYYEIVRGHVALFIKRLLFPVVVFFVLSPWGELSSTYFC